ncbi:Uncharacterised protein [Mycobacteroides abscessus subsp. abscessus]|nr:Uncharacterised protein [Mycobacteroides abscessus subsp. abscessus]
MTTRNSAVTMAPRTFAEKSTRAMPMSPTTAHAMSAHTAHGTVSPKSASRIEERTKPNIPTIPICIAL